MAKKKAKGVLEKIGNAVAAGADAVVDAGSKAIQTVGDMIPTGKTPKKKAAKAKGKSTVKASTSKAKDAVAKPKGAAAKAKAGSAASRKAAKPAKKAAARPKKAASKKG